MANSKWHFTKEQLSATPSRKCGFDEQKEISYRQQASNFIQDMGQRLQVSQLCINTAVVYMQRFYVFHSFTHFQRYAMATAAIFLSAKVEEQALPLERVVKVSQVCLFRDKAQLDVKSKQFLELCQDLIFNENVLLQTLGFDVTIDHPHVHIVRCCNLIHASKDLSQTSYFLASSVLQLTTMCLRYKPTVLACFCIHLACKWSNWEIPQSNEGKSWSYYVDRSVTEELLEQLTEEFLIIYDKYPSRLKQKIMSANQNSSNTQRQRNGEQSSHCNSKRQTTGQGQQSIFSPPSEKPAEQSQSSNQIQPTTKHGTSEVTNHSSALQPVETSSGGLLLNINVSQISSSPVLSSTSPKNRKRDWDSSSPQPEPTISKVQKVQKCN